MALTDNISAVLDNSLVVGVASGLTGAAIGGTAGYALGKSSSKKKKSSRKRKKITHTKRGWKLDRKKYNKRQKWEVAYRKRKRKKSKSRSRRGKVKYTKNGQPYIILKSGKARFIKGRRKR